MYQCMQLPLGSDLPVEGTDSGCQVECSSFQPAPLPVQIRIHDTLSLSLSFPLPLSLSSSPYFSLFGNLAVQVIGGAIGGCR